MASIIMTTCKSVSLSFPKLTITSPNYPNNPKPITCLQFPYSNSSLFNPVSSLKVKVAVPKRRIFACDSTAQPHQNSEPVDSTIDLKLPRRSLLVQFTCDECGERTQKLINRLAYERGLVYVQCAGCLQYHKLADNLGLVVEYDLRDEM